MHSSTRARAHTYTHTAVFICFVSISEQTAIISLYNINLLVFVTQTECVYCAVRNEPLYKYTLIPVLEVMMNLHVGFLSDVDLRHKQCSAKEVRWLYSPRCFAE